MSEISEERKRITAAIVDKDLWVYTGVPDKMQIDGVIFTHGYSIENDLYMDSQIESLCDDDDTTLLNEVLAYMSKWLARESLKIISGEEGCISYHPNRVKEFMDAFPDLNEEEMKLFDKIRSDYGVLMRGHTLFEALASTLCRKGRIAKYSKRQLYEISSTQFSSIFDRHEQEIRSYLTA